MGKDDEGAHAREDSIDGKPPFDHIQAGFGAGIIKSCTDECNNTQCNTPSEKTSPDAFRRNRKNGGNVYLFSYLFEDPGNVSRPHDGNYFGTGCTGNCMSQKGVPFVDESNLDFRNLFTEGLQGKFEGIMFFEFFDFFFRDVIGVKERQKDFTHDSDFTKELHRSPRAGHGRTNVPIGKDNIGTDCFRLRDGPPHFFTRIDTEFFGKPFLE